MPLRWLQRFFLLLILVMLCVPVLAAVMGSWLQWDAVTADILQQMGSTVLPDYAWTTLRLCLMVALGTVVIGSASAAAVTLFEFPGRRVAEWALLLPLAMPAYVVAYAYTDFLQFSGPLQTGCGPCSGWKGACFPRCAVWAARPGCSRFRSIPMCTAGPHGAGRTCDPFDGGGASARRADVPAHPRGGTAAGAPGDGRRSSAGADGDPGRLWRVELLRHPDLLGRHLQGLAGDGQPDRRCAAGHRAAGGGDGAAEPGAPGAKAHAFLQRARRSRQRRRGPSRAAGRDSPRRSVGGLRGAGAAGLSCCR
jgi:hypothetical protein